MIEPRRVSMAFAFAVLAVATLSTSQPPRTQPPEPSPTTPPAGNDQTLRKLSPDEIPPNLSFYAMDPLYRPGAPRGWASAEIRERLDRGLVAVASDAGRVHLSWRLLDSDPATIAFNVYRVSGVTETRLNARPIRTTTDFVETAPAEKAALSWRVVPVLDGREDRTAATTWSGLPVDR